MEAAATVIFLASSQAMVEKWLKGKYFIPIATEAGVSKVGEDEKLARELWKWTNELIQRMLREAGTAV